LEIFLPRELFITVRYVTVTWFGHISCNVLLYCAFSVACSSIYKNFVGHSEIDVAFITRLYYATLSQKLIFLLKLCTLYAVE